MLTIYIEGHTYIRFQKKKKSMPLLMDFQIKNQEPSHEPSWQISNSCLQTFEDQTVEAEQVDEGENSLPFTNLLALSVRHPWTEGQNKKSSRADRARKKNNNFQLIWEHLLRKNSEARNYTRTSGSAQL